MANKMLRFFTLRIQTFQIRQFASESGKAKKPGQTGPVKPSDASPALAKPSATIPLQPKPSAVSQQKAMASEILSKVGASAAVDNSDNTKYRCPEYYTFDSMSFYDLELTHQQYRIPQPSAISPSS